MEKIVEQKLKALKSLQALDSSIDEIKKIRGVLPEEVQDLEDEIVRFQTRLEKQIEEANDYEVQIENSKVTTKDTEKLIAKYEEQQMEVRNNREYEAITKEVELQKLEIQIIEKKAKELYLKVETNKGEQLKTQEDLKEKKEALDSKKGELQNIMNESEEEEQKLLTSREKIVKKVEERLLKSYEKIRNNMRNGLAVVPVKRGACGGCFSIVPPQRQSEIREKKKIIVCEHCGRVFYDVLDQIIEEEAKPVRRRTTRKKKEA